jgi:transmembrane 9 superfamily member 2/4
MVIGLWISVNLPLVFIGGYFGFRQKKIEIPVDPLKIPRQIPNQPLYMKAPISVLLGGKI